MAPTGKQIGHCNPCKRANSDATKLYDVTFIKLSEEKLPVQRIEAAMITLKEPNGLPSF